MKLAALLFAAILLFGGCDPDEGSLGKVEDVVAAMEDEGIDCEGLDTTTEFGNELDARVTERGICLADGDRVVISVFDDAADRDRWVEDGELRGKVAVGGNWVAGSDSDQLVEEIAAALDATIVSEENG